MAKTENEWFAQVPSDLLNDSSVSVGCRLVYAQLNIYADVKTWECYPSNKLLADGTGKSRRQIQYWMRELEIAGWIKRVGQRGFRRTVRLSRSKAIATKLIVKNTLEVAKRSSVYGANKDKTCAKTCVVRTKQPSPQIPKKVNDTSLVDDKPFTLKAHDTSPELYQDHISENNNLVFKKESMETDEDIETELINQLIADILNRVGGGGGKYWIKFSEEKSNELITKQFGGQLTTDELADAFPQLRHQILRSN